jgi:hypothetical protein
MHRSHYLIQYQCTIKSHTKTLLIQYSTVDTAYTSAALGFFQRCVYTSCINTPAALFCNYTPVASKPQLHFPSYPSCIKTSATLFFIPQLHQYLSCTFLHTPVNYTPDALYPNDRILLPNCINTRKDRIVYPSCIYTSAALFFIPQLHFWHLIVTIKQPQQYIVILLIVKLY